MAATNIAEQIFRHPLPNRQHQERATLISHNIKKYIRSYIGTILIYEALTETD